MKSTLVALALAMTASSALAQTFAPPPTGAPPNPPPARAKGPPMALALEAAQVAIAACKANGYNTTALIVDTANVPIVLLTGDGASPRTPAVAAGKTAITVKYKVASGVIVQRISTDAALKAEVEGNPEIRQARRGALPLMAGGELIGAFAVSGAPGGDKDEACAQAGIDKIASRLK